MSALDLLDWDSVDFLDLGCSKGGSLEHCTKRFGAGRGIGVDIDESKVLQTRDAGHDAVVADATALDLERRVSFVTMMDFLEHLPDLEVVEAVIASASEAATDFLFISHPSFEGEEYLRALGLRQYWWHWSGHTSHVRVSDYCQIFDRLGLRQYMIRYLKPILDSSHESVLTTAERKNQNRYDPEIHRPRPDVSFEQPVWRSQEIFVALRPFSADEWADITRPRTSAPRAQQ